MTLLSCDDLTIGYDGRAVAEHISMALHTGDYVCVVGENGSGKTTFLKTILSLIKPMSGTITFAPKLTIGYLPQQNPSQRDFPASAWEIVLSGTDAGHVFHPFHTREDKAKAIDAMTRLGIANLKDRPFGELSGGQMQRVLLARALCASGELLVMDEPTSGLDPEATKVMYDLINDINHNDHVGILMISHDIGAALRDASHILHMGEDVWFGTKEDYVKERGHHE